MNDRLPRALEAVFTTPLSASSSIQATSSGTSASASTAIPTPTQDQNRDQGVTQSQSDSQSQSQSPNPTQRLTPPSINGDRLPDIRAPSTAPPRRRGPRMSDESRDQENWPSRPVARVNSVEPGSPAHESVRPPSPCFVVALPHISIIP